MGQDTLSAPSTPSLLLEDSITALTFKADATEGTTDCAVK